MDFFWVVLEIFETMKLLKLASEENVVSAYPDPHCLQITEFNNLYEQSDKPERLFAYIYNMHDIDSNYLGYNKDERANRIKEDLFGDPNYELSEIAKEAEEKYIELTTSPQQRLLESAISNIYKLIDYFEEFNPTERDDRGKLVWSTKDLIKNMKDLDGVVESLEDLKERVEKGEKQKGKIRGDVQTTKWNR